MQIEEKRRKARRIAFLLIGVNLFLFTVKWIPTLTFTSISVKADAFNSLGDFAYSALILVGFELLFQPKDTSHPHGHERFEPFISLIVAIAITITGVMILRDSIQTIFNSQYSIPLFMVIPLLASAGIKYWLSNYLEKKSKEMGSNAVKSSSEDAKADVLASGVAIAGVLGGWAGIEYVDVIFGLIVSVWIFRTAYSIGRENFGYLTGAGAPQKIREKIMEILEKNPQVIGYHSLEAHYVGPEIHVTVSIHLPEDVSFEKVHRIEEKLKEEMKLVKNVHDVYLHLEPENSENNEDLATR